MAATEERATGERVGAEAASTDEFTRRGSVELVYEHVAARRGDQRVATY